MRKHPANDLIATMGEGLRSLPLSKAERTRIVAGALPILDLALDEMNRDIDDIKAGLDSIEGRLRKKQS